MAKRLRDIFNTKSDYNFGGNEVSSPVSVLLTATGGPYSNVKFLYAAKNANLTNYGLPSGPTGSVTPTTNSSTDYGQMLQMLQNSAYKISKIKVISNNATFLRTPFKITQYDGILGSETGRTIPIDKNSFQVQTDQVTVSVNFTLDRGTEITIPSFPAGASVEFRFYPAKAYENFFGETGKTYRIPQDGVNIISNKKTINFEY